MNSDHLTVWQIGNKSQGQGGGAEDRIARLEKSEGQSRVRSPAD